MGYSRGHMKHDMQIHVVRCNAAYWYAEVKSAPGARLDGKGGFASEDAARDWARQVTDARAIALASTDAG